jgi:hypothetical protein
VRLVTRFSIRVRNEIRILAPLQMSGEQRRAVQSDHRGSRSKGVLTDLMASADMADICRRQ